MMFLSFVFISSVLLGFTSYSMYKVLNSEYIGINVSTLMYLCSLIGLMWYSVFDYILHNLFSKQRVVVEPNYITKFHIKNLISTCVWVVSLIWTTLIFTVQTLPQQLYIDYYPSYVFTLAIFYLLVSIPRTIWKDHPKSWFFEILFWIMIYFTIKIITAAIFLLLIKI
jgi:hypothetical protein